MAGVAEGLEVARAVVVATVDVVDLEALVGAAEAVARLAGVAVTA